MTSSHLARNFMQSQICRHQLLWDICATFIYNVRQPMWCHAHVLCIWGKLVGVESILVCTDVMYANLYIQYVYTCVYVLWMYSTCCIIICIWMCYCIVSRWVTMCSAYSCSVTTGTDSIELHSSCQSASMLVEIYCTRPCIWMHCNWTARHSLAGHFNGFSTEVCAFSSAHVSAKSLCTTISGFTAHAFIYLRSIWHQCMLSPILWLFYC